MDQETDVQFEADGKEVGDLIQSFVRLPKFTPICGDQLSQRVQEHEVQGKKSFMEG